MPVLSHGMRGAQVELAQAALNFHALRGDPRLVVDGTFGNQTKERTIAFQRIAGLKADGIIGPATEAKLLAAVEISGEIHYRETPPVAARTPVGRSANAGSPFGQLTLPQPAQPRQLPRLVPQLTLTVPLVQGQSTFFPPQILKNPAAGAVSIFPITATVLQPIWYSPSGNEETSGDAARAFWARILYVVKPLPRTLSTATIEPYLKIEEAPHPVEPDENIFKAKGGVAIKVNTGRIELELKGGVSFAKYYPATGAVSAGLYTLDGQITATF